MSTNATRRKFLAAAATTAAAGTFTGLANAAPNDHDRSAANAPVSARGVIAVVQKDVCSLGFYDLRNGQSLTQIPLPEQSHEITATPGSRYAYVSQYGVKQWVAPGEGGNVVSVIDLFERKLVRSIDLTPYRRLHGVRVDSNGRLYVLSETSSIIAVFDEPETKVYPTQLTPVGGVRSHYFVITADGNRAYVSDTLSGMVIAMHPHDPLKSPLKVISGRGPEGCCLSADEKTLYVVNRFGGDMMSYSTDTLRPIKRASTQGESVRVAAISTGEVLVGNAARKSVLVKRADLTDIHEISLPASPTALTVDTANERVYVSVESNQVLAINTCTMQIEQTIPVQRGADSAWVYGA